jgi:hypothetical protein
MGADVGAFGGEMMKTIATNSSGVRELLELAARVERLARQASQEPETYRISGRLARDPHDVDAFSAAIVDDAKRGDARFPMIDEMPMGYALLQHAMRQVSMFMWEELWNGAHPDQFGLGWEGEDLALMSVWREKVRAMARECNQQAILAMTASEYVDRLTEAGVNEEDADTLAEWVLEIRVGDTPST